MLKWIVFIKSLNSILIHVIKKKNLVANMLSRAKYSKKKEMLAQEKDGDLVYSFVFFTNRRY